jgi:hypothetical protein
MNALQSLSTSGVHAKRCSSVPCAKQGAGEAVVDSKVSDPHNCGKRIGGDLLDLFARMGSSVALIRL